MLKYRSLTKEIMGHPVTGLGLKAGALRSHLHQSKPVLLVFLGHLASQFSKETVRDIRTAQNRDPEYPEVLFVMQENADTGQAFFNLHWPRAKAVSDPELFLFGEFGIPTAGLLDIAGPGVTIARIRAAAKGNFGSWPTGNIWQMPGFIVISGNQIVWSHNYRHAGDRPALQRMTYLLHSLNGRKHSSKPVSKPVSKPDPKHISPSTVFRIGIKAKTG